MNKDNFLVFFPSLDLNKFREWDDGLKMRVMILILHMVRVIMFIIARGIGPTGRRGSSSRVENG